MQTPQKIASNGAHRQLHVEQFHEHQIRKDQPADGDGEYRDGTALSQHDHRHDEKEPGGHQISDPGQHHQVQAQQDREPQHLPNMTSIRL